MFPRTLEELLDMPEEQQSPALGAALLSRDAYPDLDIDALLERFDALAAPMKKAHIGRLDIVAQAEFLCAHVYGALGFKGNAKDYYDPKNSLLPDVIERRTGIPITLAVVFIEIARRAGVIARGVSFPGHFLVRIDDDLSTPDHMVIIDPFEGRPISRARVEELLRRALGASAELSKNDLTPCDTRSLLVRILTNLKSLYIGRGDLARAHLAVDRVVTLLPFSTAALKERATLALKLGAVEAARSDFARALALEPDTTRAKELEKELGKLNQKRATLN
jgi:regulator of sirC expression with transglutaminase-like and TPR domain